MRKEIITRGITAVQRIEMELNTLEVGEAIHWNPDHPKLDSFKTQLHKAIRNLAPKSFKLKTSGIDLITTRTL